MRKLLKSSIYTYSTHPNTLKKLTLMVTYRCLVPGKTKLPERFEKAKDLIRRRLCPNCRIKYLNKWTNDFVSLNKILCSFCCQKVFDLVLNRAQFLPGSGSGLPASVKKIVLQSILELAFDKPIKDVLFAWHRQERKSTFEIQELLQKEFNIYITARSISSWLERIGILRSHVEALRNRVVTKRMDYSKRKKRSFLANNERKTHQTKHVSICFTKNELARIQKVADAANLTKADVIRNVFRYKNRSILLSKKRLSRREIVLRGIEQYKDKLLSAAMDNRRDIRISFQKL